MLLPANCLRVLYLSQQTPTTFLGDSFGIAEMGSYHHPCHWGAFPWTTRRRSHQAPMDSLIQRGIYLSSKLGWGPFMHHGTQWVSGTSKGRGALLIRLIRTWVQIQTCPRRQKGSLITSQWDILVTTNFGVKPCLSVSRSGMEVQCCMRVCENASWDAAQLWSEWRIPSLSVSVWQSGNEQRYVEIRVTTLLWSVWLITLKRDLMETTELTPNKLKVLCKVD
jgi:hypothetical protein